MLLKQKWHIYITIQLEISNFNNFQLFLVLNFQFNSRSKIIFTWNQSNEANSSPVILLAKCPKVRTQRFLFYSDIFYSIIELIQRRKTWRNAHPSFGSQEMHLFTFPPDLILSNWSHTVNRKLCTFQILSELSSLWTYQIMYWSGNAGVNIGMHMLCKRSQLYNVETFSTYEIYFRSFFRFFPKLFHFFHPIYFFSNPDKWSVYASAAHFFIIC